MKARGIPDKLVRCVGTFCSDGTPSVVVNGRTSKRRVLAQAGLPQGSSLSPVSFLFFNADLVQRKINANWLNYTAWVTGPTAEETLAGIQVTTDNALKWETRSEQNGSDPLHEDCVTVQIKGKDFKPKSSVKALGVIMDANLRYKGHMTRAAAKFLAAAPCLRRLKVLSPRTARQLFVSTVAPVVDYASNVWMHSCDAQGLAWLNRVQKVGAQVITGALGGTAVAEAEASIQTVQE